MSGDKGPVVCKGKMGQVFYQGKMGQVFCHGICNLSHNMWSVTGQRAHCLSEAEGHVVCQGPRDMQFGRR